MFSLSTLTTLEQINIIQRKDTLEQHNSKIVVLYFFLYPFTLAALLLKSYHSNLNSITKFKGTNS